MTLRHTLIMVLVSLIWGANFVITKVGLVEIPPLLFSALRYIFVAFPLVFFVKRGTVPWTLIIQIGIVMGVFAFTFSFIGIRLGVPAGKAAFLLQAQIIFTLGFSRILFQDHLTRPQLLGVFLAASGVGLLIFGFNEASSLVGAIFVLLGAVFMAISNIILKKNTDVDMFRLMVWMGLIPPIPLLALSMIFETGQMAAITDISAMGIFAVLHNAYASTILAFALYGYLLRRYPLSKVAPLTFLVPVFALLGGVVFLDERLAALSLIGCGLILLGVVLPRLIKREPAGALKTKLRPLDL